MGKKKREEKRKQKDRGRKEMGMSYLEFAKLATFVPQPLVLFIAKPPLIQKWIRMVPALS